MRSDDGGKQLLHIGARAFCHTVQLERAHEAMVTRAGDTMIATIQMAVCGDISAQSAGRVGSALEDGRYRSSQRSRLRELAMRLHRVKKP